MKSVFLRIRMDIPYVGQTVKEFKKEKTSKIVSSNHEMDFEKYIISVISKLSKNIFFGHFISISINMSSTFIHSQSKQFNSISLSNFYAQTLKNCKQCPNYHFLSLKKISSNFKTLIMCHFISKLPKKKNPPDSDSRLLTSEILY